MKHSLYIIAFSILTIVSCSRYDDTAIWDELRNHEERIAELETRCERINSNITALEVIVDALNQKDYVTGVTEIVEGNEVIGYTITFSKSEPVNIYHGKDGEDGTDGEDGKDGIDGTDGYTPVIGIKKGDDGIYYWTLDGEWLLDSEGNRIPANGVNGNDGANGSAGKNGTSPKLKIENGYWYISLDGGQTWQPEPLGPATAGAGGNIFTDITYTTSYLHITLADGKVITLSRSNGDISDYCVIDEFIIEGRKASFTGHINVEKEDIQYCKVSIYYSDAEDFNIHTAKVASTTVFDYNNSFTISCTGLEYGVTYKYCLCLDVKSQVLYNPVDEFTTDEGKNRDYIEFGFNDYIENGVDLNSLLGDSIYTFTKNENKYCCNSRRIRNIW